MAYGGISVFYTPSIYFIKFQRYFYPECNVYGKSHTRSWLVRNSSNYIISVNKSLRLHRYHLCSIIVAITSQSKIKFVTMKTTLFNQGAKIKFAKCSKTVLRSNAWNSYCKLSQKSFQFVSFTARTQRARKAWGTLCTRVLQKKIILPLFRGEYFQIYIDYVTQIKHQVFKLSKYRPII